MDMSLSIKYPTGTVLWIFNDDAKFSKRIQYAVTYQEDGVELLGYDNVWFDKDGKSVQIETHDGIFWEDADWVSTPSEKQQEA